MATNKDIIPSKEIWIGSSQARVSVVVFVDYESLACAQLNEILHEILQSYEGNVKLNFRHFPLANKHQKAMKAAEAAVAAAQENMFWPMHNIMFANRKKLGTISLKAYAKEIGITNKRFLDQLVNGVYAWQVREDLMEGLDRGVRDVPAVFINGDRYEGEFTFSGLTQAIEIKLRTLGT
ncbi:DsbA family protein [Aridibaculum aurantiacum]|uniref:DsbA family protein n=1 Tax=Aridibaculum aurantiacum TaxID=2810307 RepID=UPI001A97B39C|nr:thioredoxin domain-containing protein [Aridibaculum aurantiacum]